MDNNRDVGPLVQGVHRVVTDTVRPTVTTTVVPNTHFVLVGLSHCFTVPYPCKVHKITSHQRNSKKVLFVHTSLTTPVHSTLSQSRCVLFSFFTLISGLSYVPRVFFTVISGLSFLPRTRTSDPRRPTDFANYTRFS